MTTTPEKHDVCDACGHGRNGRRAWPVRTGFMVFLPLLPLGDVILWPNWPWLTFTKIGFLLLVIAVVWARFQGWRPVQRPGMDLVLLYFLLAIGWAALRSDAPGYSFVMVLRLCGLAVVGLIASWLTPVEGHRRWLPACLLGVGTPLALLALYQTHFGRTILGLGVYSYFGRMIELTVDRATDVTTVVRASATFDHPNLYGAFLITTLASGACLLPYFGPRRRLLIAAALALNTAALVCTFSRSAWLGALFSLTAASIVVMGMRTRMVLAASVAAGVLLGVMTLPPGTHSVLLNRGGGTVQRYDVGRLYSYQTALRMMLENLGHGVGPGRFHDAYPEYAPLDDGSYQNPLHHKDAHNTFLDLGAEAGLGVFILFATVVIVSIRHSFPPLIWRWRRKQRRERPALWTLISGVALLGLIVQGQFQTLQYQEVLWIVLGIGWALPPAPRDPINDHLSPHLTQRV